MSLIAYVKTLWANGTTPAISATNLGKIEDGIKAVTDEVIAHEADLVTHPDYGTTTGSANTYVLTLDPVPVSYTEGMGIVVKINADNTGASTINVNSLGAKTIKAPDGTDLSAGDLKTDSIYALRYNGVNFILQGKGGVVLTGDAAVGDVLSGKTFYNTDPKTILTGTLSLGKKVAMGSATPVSQRITVSGLAFLPKVVHLFIGSTLFTTVDYNAYVYTTTNYYLWSPGGIVSFGGSDYVTNGGFSFHTANANAQQWIVIE